MKAAPKVPEMRPAVTHTQVEIISFLTAALALIFYFKNQFVFLEKHTKEKQCSLHSHHPAGSSHLKAQHFFFFFATECEGSELSEVSQGYVLYVVLLNNF